MNLWKRLFNRKKKEVETERVKWDVKFTVKHRDYPFAIYEIQSEEGKGYKISWDFIVEGYGEQQTGSTYYTVTQVHELIESGTWIVQ